MSKLSRIANLITNNVPLHQTATLVPRGYAIPVDMSLHGVTRFARRLGGTFSVLTPHNTMAISQAVKQGDASIYVIEPIQNMPVGSIVSFLGRESHFVSDVVTHSDGKQSVELASSTGVLALGYPIDTSLYLHSVPVTTTLAASVGGVTLAVSSVFRIVLGDSIELLADQGITGSVVAYTVTGIPSAVETSSPYLYTLGLSPPLTRDVALGETIYLRAFPAFLSDLIPLPTQPNVFGGSVGPFLWDILEGRMHDGVDPVTTTLAMETVSSGYMTLDALAVISKNTPHWRVALESSAFLFFDLIHGTLDFYQGASRLVQGIFDTEGDFLISKEVRPAFQDVTWRAAFLALGGDVSIRIGFHLKDPPSATPTPPTGYTYDASLRVYFKDFVCNSASVHSEIIASPPGYLCDRIDLGAYQDSGATGVVLRDWSQAGGKSSWVRYTIVGRVHGDYVWGSSGLLVKPIFFGRDHLQLVQRFDSGVAMV